MLDISVQTDLGAPCDETTNHRFAHIDCLDEPPLAPREIEVLAWIAVGKSDWQIGQILMVSPKTVNYHVEKAKRKFNVATRIQAVVTAVRLGLLDTPLALLTLEHDETGIEPAH